MSYEYMTPKSLSLFQELYAFRNLRTEFISRLTGAGRYGTRNQLTYRHKQGYIERPPAQFRAYNNLWCPKIHSLSKKGFKELSDRDLVPYRIVPETTRRKEFAHQMMIADTLASIKIGCIENGLKFIPHEEITSAVGHDIVVKMPYKTNFKGVHYEGTLTPDAMFAIEYPDGTRSYFVLESENYSPLDPDDRKGVRSSLKRKIVGYRDINKKKTYQQFGLKNMRVLVVSGTAKKVQNRVDFVEKNFGESRLFLFNNIPVQELEFKAPQPFPELLTSNWKRAGLSPQALFTDNEAVVV